ncbi:MAG: hypothetical protein KDA74_08885 [Planctomycetaceae bacterium]|nr:hypothetical protein [Planctomycetaceae bacterium]
MKRLITAFAFCAAAVVMLSSDTQAAEIQTAYQPRPGGVIDVITSPFRALTQPVSYRTAQQTYRPYYGQASYGSTNCVNGVCYPTSNYASPCASGNCGAGMACPGGNCGTGYSTANCPGGNCNLTQYRYPTQNYISYPGAGWNNVQQYPTYRPVSQPVYRTSVPASTNSIRNDPFFP